MRWRITATLAVITLCLVIGSPPAQATPIFNDTGPDLISEHAIAAQKPIDRGSTGTFIDNYIYASDMRLGGDKERVAISAHRVSSLSDSTYGDLATNGYAGFDLRRPGLNHTSGAQHT